MIRLPVLCGLLGGVVCWGVTTAWAQEPELRHHTVGSPEWLRLSTWSVSAHPYPGVAATTFSRWYTDPWREPTWGDPLFAPTFGDYFEFIFPYQGLPGVMTVPAGWMTPKLGDANSVRNINYLAIQKATRMLHRKGHWVVYHVPASSWWPASSNVEAHPEGIEYINMRLLDNDPPADGFNFDAGSEVGTDLDAIRARAEEVLPGGHYVMYGEWLGDYAAFNSHYTYLFGLRPQAWEDDLHGSHYLWFGIAGLGAHDQDGTLENWGQRVQKLMMWDTLIWGGHTAPLELRPAHFFDPAEARQFAALERFRRDHGDLLGLLREPQVLPDSEVLAGNLAVMLFDGAAPAYFRTPDGPDGDKRLYAFKTGGLPVPFGHPEYYVQMPPMPERGPLGDLFWAPAEEGYHYVSYGVDGAWRTPVRPEGERVIISAERPVGRYGSLPQRGETIYVARYRNLLQVARSGDTSLQVRVGRRYQENTLVEVVLKRQMLQDRTESVIRPVINGEVAVDLGAAFHLPRLEPTDRLHVRLLREHPLDEWHLPHFLLDEVILSVAELGVAARLTELPPGPVAPGEPVVIGGEISNRTDRPQSLRAIWHLPDGWVAVEGETQAELTVEPGAGANVTLTVTPTPQAPFGGGKLRLLAHSGQWAQGVAIHQGEDSALVIAGHPQPGGAEDPLRVVSVETGGFRGLGEVPLPLTAELDLPAGRGVRVVEYDAQGAASAEELEAGVQRLEGDRALVTWTARGDENRAVRTFGLYPAEKEAGPAPLIAARNLSLAPGERLVSPQRYRYATLEVRMSGPQPGPEDSWVGWMAPPPAGWSYDRFLPDTAAHLVAWNLRDHGNENLMAAMFDNGSGMVEVSSGKRLRLEGFGVLDCDQVWGDLGWPHGNGRLNRINPWNPQTYRIEWQRLHQRWYANGELVYERLLAQPEPLPLMLENGGPGELRVEWVRVSSPFVGRQTGG